MKNKNKEMIKQLLLHALQNLHIHTDEILVTFANILSNGDYTSNIALSSAKIVKLNPKELAQKIVTEIKKIGIPQEIKQVEVAGSGYINFYFSSQYFDSQIKQIVNLSADYGKSMIYNHKTILVEHSSPNLFKPFHIGHLMNNTIGESIVRIAEYSGAKVIRISYPSDISLGIGKAIWALIKNNSAKIDLLNSLQEKVAFLGECYVNGNIAFDESEDARKQIRIVTQKLFDKIDSTELDLYEKCKEINLSYFKTVVERLDSRLDAYIFESEAGIEGEKIVRQHIGDVFENSAGAVIYRGENDGLHTRVFVNKDGYPTYESKDIGLLSLKFNRYNPDISIFITDSEQKNYFEVVSAAAYKINPNWSEKTIHRTHGRMSFKGKKMSSRHGGVPLATTIIDTLAEDVKSRAPTLELSNIENISVGAIKFSILRVMAGKNINFDPETSLSFEGDSGPYLQYTAVRASSVLKKAKFSSTSINLIKSSSERNIYDIERLIVRFPEVVEQMAEDWSPHYMTTYLLELAQSFNSWYGSTKIIDSNNPMMQSNLLLVSAVYIVIKNGLYLLGIKTPSNM